MKKPSKKPRKASIYLVRFVEISAYDRQLANFVELFFNKRDAINFQRHNGGVLTRWSFGEQIVLPKVKEVRRR